MTRKLLTYLSPTPSPTSPDLVDGVNRSKFNFFSRTAPTQTNKDICTGTTCADPGFFCQGEGGGGGGSRLLNLSYSLQRGSNGFITHFPGRGGSNFSQGGGGGSKC